LGAISVSIGVFFWFLTGLIALSYHPIAPGIHLIPVRIALAAIGVLACFALVVRHSTEKRRALFLRNALELTAVPAILWIAFQIWSANYQQPDHLRLVYRGDTYSIPRIYRPVQSSDSSSHDYIRVTTCGMTSEPVYASACNSNSSGLVELSTRLMIERSDVYTSLDRAGATYDGDMVTNRGSDAGVLSDGSFDYHQGAYRNWFLLGNTGQIERFAQCFPVTETCIVLARTPQGILSFHAGMTDTGALNFWRDKEENWLAAFGGWRCAETTCDGRFD